MESKYYPITWVHSLLNGNEGYVGFCGKTNMVYHIVPSGQTINSYLPFIVHDLLIDKDGRCEEEKGCLAQCCPLNHTTPASYWQRHGLPGRHPEKPLSAFAAGFELPEELRGKRGGIITSKDLQPVIKIDNIEETP